MQRVRIWELVVVTPVPFPFGCMSCQVNEETVVSMVTEPGAVQMAVIIIGHSDHSGVVPTTPDSVPSTGAGIQRW